MDLNDYVGTASGRVGPLALRPVRCVICLRPTGVMNSTGRTASGSPTCDNCDLGVGDRDMRQDRPEAFDLDEEEENVDDVRPRCPYCGHTRFELRRTTTWDTTDTDTDEYDTDDDRLFFDLFTPEHVDHVTCGNCSNDVSGEFRYEVQ